MSIMLAVDILGCTGSAEERAALLHRTIQLAAELRGTMGNMFSFAAVMSALEMAQVLRSSRVRPGACPLCVCVGGGSGGDRRASCVSGLLCERPRRVLPHFAV